MLYLLVFSTSLLVEHRAGGDGDHGAQRAAMGLACAGRLGGSEFRGDGWLLGVPAPYVRRVRVSDRARQGGGLAACVCAAVACARVGGRCNRAVSGRHACDGRQFRAVAGGRAARQFGCWRATRTRSTRWARRWRARAPPRAPRNATRWEPTCSARRRRRAAKPLRTLRWLERWTPRGALALLWRDLLITWRASGWSNLLDSGADGSRARRTRAAYPLHRAP
jgi:hypothetical protein